MTTRMRVAQAQEPVTDSGSITWSEILAWWLIGACFAITIGMLVGEQIRGW